LKFVLKNSMRTLKAMSIGEQLMNLGFLVAHYSGNVYKTWLLSTVTPYLFIPLPRGVFSTVNRNNDGLQKKDNEECISL
ncbi:hypothetical protein V1478_015845, partial [Vespula squamosa]